MTHARAAASFLSEDVHQSGSSPVPNVQRSAFFLRMSSHTCRRSERWLTLSDRDDALVVVEEVEERPGLTAQAWLATIKVMM